MSEEETNNAQAKASPPKKQDTRFFQYKIASEMAEKKDKNDSDEPE